MNQVLQKNPYWHYVSLYYWLFYMTLWMVAHHFRGEAHPGRSFGPLLLTVVARIDGEEVQVKGFKGFHFVFSSLGTSDEFCKLIENKKLISLKM